MGLFSIWDCGFLLNRLREITTDYYEDVIKLKWHAGKSWIAPKVLIREDVCALFLDSSWINVEHKIGPTRKPYTFPI